MDEKLLRKLSKQLRWLNIVVTFFALMAVTTMVVIGFLLFQALTLVKDTGDTINQFQDNTGKQLNVKERLCSDGEFGSFLRSNSNICSE